jgi:hypothetical protein
VIWHFAAWPDSERLLVFSGGDAVVNLPDRIKRRTCAMIHLRVATPTACKLGLEGIVSKRKDSPYRSGRSPDWLKMKNSDAPGREARRGGRMGQKEMAITAARLARAAMARTMPARKGVA